MEDNKIPEFSNIKFSILEGTEWDEEHLNLVLLVNHQLNIMIRIDLLTKVTKYMNIPNLGGDDNYGIPKHFKKINQERFDDLIQLYFKS